MATETHIPVRQYAPGQHPALPPPPAERGVIRWLRHNLFSSWLNTALTLLGLAIIYWTVPPLLNWAFFEANWTGESRADCTRDGACWAVIGARWQQFLSGFFPQEEIWRVWAFIVVLILAVIPLLSERAPFRRYWLWFAYASPVVMFVLLYGGFGLPVVETERWGGFMLTLVIGVTGIAASLPIGILLALGRRSDMPVIRALCTGFIEFIRGVPLITILFFSSAMLPLFLPAGVSMDKLLRALVVVALFSSAYMAEVVRGGLQAIPKGQYEAARSLGLGYWQTMLTVILPQALRIVIPGIVNNFIALFKDTTLVAIIGLFDLLGVGMAALADVKWLGLSSEVYVFVGAVFWIICFAMSRYSMWLERRLDTGHSNR